ncbi:hypothetical protein HaLaN_30746, partial [Haematococcus lacustris]
MDPGARRMMWDAVIRATAPSPASLDVQCLSWADEVAI